MALVYRSYFALARAGFATRAGEPTGATYGVTNYLLRLLREVKPEYLAVALDTPEPTFRHERLPEYKETRPPMPPDLVVQLPRVRQVMEALEVATIELPGYEADDLLATLAVRGREAGFAVFIVSSDKDLLQMVGEGVRVIVPGRRGAEDLIVDEAGVRARLGVPPGQVVELLAMTGDASDNIAGVPGIGPGNASALLARFGSVDGVYAGLGEIERAGVREKLRAHEERVRMNRELIVLERDVPIDVPWESLRVRPISRERLAPLFRELEFRRLTEALTGGEGAGGGAEGETAEGERAAGAAAPAGAAAEAGTSASRGDFARLCERARQAKGAAIAFGGEGGAGGSGAKGRGAKGAGEREVALAVPGGDAVLVSLGGAGTEGRVLDEERRELGAILADPSIGKWTTDFKGLTRWARGEHWPIEGELHDTGLALYLLGGGRGADLGAISDFGGEGEEGEEGRGAGAGEAEGPAPAPNLDLWSEAAESAAGAAGSRDRALAEARRVAALIPSLASQVREAGMERLYREVEIPLAAVLAEMEETGIAVDLAELQRLSAEMLDTLRAREEEIHRVAGASFNINSTRQVKEVIFGRLGLSPGRRTRSGFSTDMAVLSRLAREHPLPGLILRYRHLAKLRSTFAEGLAAMVNPQTGRIHTTFDQTGTVTGRLSSRDPNLQNIPIRTEEGRALRRVFVAGQAGWHLVSADYSQIELRILAHLVPDEGLVGAFQAGTDFHTATAGAIFGVAPRQVTGEMRRRAKMVNYGIIYGMGSRALAQSMEIQEKEARTFIKNYFASFPGVEKFIADTLERARVEGFVTTIAGRRRVLPELRSTRREIRAMAERAAVNARIQGSAADIMKAALVRLHRELREAGSPARLLLTVHDEIVLEAPADASLPGLLERVVAAMKAPGIEGADRLRVPLEVSIGHGANWLEAH